MVINNATDLGKAIKEGQDTIEIEGDLRKKVIRIKATGKVAWAVAIGAIGVAIACIVFPVPEPATQVGVKALALTTAPVAVSILGVGTTITAISIAIAAGGIAALNKLRKYKVVSGTEGKLILKRE